MGKVIMSGIVPQLSAPDGLPAGYTRLAYIQSSGTQYTNTGFKPNQDTRVVLDVEITGENESLAANDFFGCRTSVSSKAFAVQWNTSNNYFQHFYNDGLDNLDFGSFNRQIIEMNKNVLLIDGVSHTRTYKSFQCDYPMYIFALNNAGTASFFSNMRVYSCQIYDNGTLVRDYVPCVTSGNVGLFDRVNKTFYGNAGTGTFIAGYMPNNQPVSFFSVLNVLYPDSAWLNTWNFTLGKTWSEFIASSENAEKDLPNLPTTGWVSYFRLADGTVEMYNTVPGTGSFANLTLYYDENRQTKVLSTDVIENKDYYVAWP